MMIAHSTMTGQELRRRRIHAGVSVKRLSCLAGIPEESLVALESLPPKRLSDVTKKKLVSCNEALQKSIATPAAEENARDPEISDRVPPFLRL